MNTGHIVQIMGPVVDVEFLEILPPLRQALSIQAGRSGSEEPSGSKRVVL